MLVELSIENIALIRELSLHLNPGLVVLTGETGAGKSIILDALGLLLGQRGTSELIRQGAESAVVEGLFSITGQRAVIAPMLEEWAVPVEEDELVVTRELHTSGRTTCRVNGRMVTVQMLRQLGRYLVQQHGQHDQQGLLRSDEQLRMLDLFGGHQAALADVRRLYESWREARNALEALRIDEQERSRQLDMLTFQIDEIEKARLSPGEEEPLREERQKLQYLDRIVSSVQAAVNAVDGTAGKPGANSLLSTALHEVAAAAAYDESLRENLSLLETAQVHAEEALRGLSHYVSDLDNDPRRIDEIENRFAELRMLERKYGATVEDVLVYLDEAKKNRDSLLHQEERIDEAQRLLKQTEERLFAASERLHQARTAAASKMSERVQATLRELDIPSAVFVVQVNMRTNADKEPVFSTNGMDEVLYLFSANRGEEPKLLSKVASGGELSRTLLSLKSVLSEVDEVSTLVFDEIDSGVSGSAAVQLARHLSLLGQRGQVLCVTHSAQIAASATSHLQIMKTETTDSTETSVLPLDEDGRVAEIARLLGSDAADGTAFEHARALLHARKHLAG
ncbi:DNA repair protein RecN [Alicyclobacillus mengziensis]|uniref:DNA repair protein RecN n=1 Tax=Alicyclobacillus mengziensis TaxID=2931921 RepID=A0A9X7VVK1_9BACL|nr:DNA repair protein RecN [Alicyclobacillus mengziensis]QSO45866.1 DNA repair protein RecN [Alicyclobacillus mengziensis]